MKRTFAKWIPLLIVAVLLAIVWGTLHSSISAVKWDVLAIHSELDSAPSTYVARDPGDATDSGHDRTIADLKGRIADLEQRLDALEKK